MSAYRDLFESYLDAQKYESWGGDIAAFHSTRYRVLADFYGIPLADAIEGGSLVPEVKYTEGGMPPRTVSPNVIKWVLRGCAASYASAKSPTSGWLEGPPMPSWFFDRSQRAHNSLDHFRDEVVALATEVIEFVWGAPPRVLTSADMTELGIGREQAPDEWEYY